jgi:hypothetical protein
MHSSENARRSQRRRPDLNINTTGTGTRSLTRESLARESLTRESLPQTPPNRRPPVPAKGSLKPAPGSRALKPPSHAMKDAGEVETFLDMITPVDATANKENDRPPSTDRRMPSQRDSHDLSLPPRHVRDSLVSNMLLSLDQFSMSQLAVSRTTFEDPLYSLTGGEDMTRTTAAANPRPKANLHSAGHGYTYSSDLEGADDASRISSQISRGRRSNSSSGFQSSLGRINSMRESLHRGSQPGTPRMLHSRGGRGSKSSSTNSIDAGYAQVLSSQRWAHGFGGRSSSFDFGHRAPASAPQHQQPQQPWHIEFSNNFFNDESIDDAAPTPTVPGGPRRLANAPSMPAMKASEPPPEPMSPGKSPDKRGTRSSRSATVGRQGQSKFNNNREIPPVPTFELDSAPAPLVGYEKSKEAVHGGPNATSQQQHAKDRPGFFRRVFGGFRDNSVDSPTSHAINSPFISSTSVESAGSPGQQHIASQMKSNSTPPSRDSHKSSHGHEHKTLQKKPSSFFRRRKKSVSEAEPPPPLPAPLRVPPSSPPVAPIKLPVSKADALAARNDPSPVTSLRKAMSPFLKGGANTPGGLTPDVLTPGSAPSPLSENRTLAGPLSAGEKEEEHRDDVRGFSPEYSPPPHATIRSVGSGSKDRVNALAEQQTQIRMDTPTRAPPEPPHPARTGSFLNDNSDSEESPRNRLPLKKSDTHLSEQDARRTQSRDHSAAASPSSKKSPRTPGENSSVMGHRRAADSTDDDDAHGSRLTLPIEGVLSPVSTVTVTSTNTAQQSTITGLSAGTDKSEPNTAVRGDDGSSKSFDEPQTFVVGDPTEDDRLKAQKIFDGNEDFIQKEKAAAWMGEEGPVRQRTLRAYMDLYDFQKHSVVQALRDVCGRLVLRAETQQVDRILVAFAARWTACNPNHGFKSTGKST